MQKVTCIHKARELKKKRSGEAVQHDGFDPCSPDMTICGDCDGNRAKNKCPRLKEWLARKQR
jgi:hypothetical protein